MRCCRSRQKKQPNRKREQPNRKPLLLKCAEHIKKLTPPHSPALEAAPPPNTTTTQAKHQQSKASSHARSDGFDFKPSTPEERSKLLDIRATEAKAELEKAKAEIAKAQAQLKLTMQYAKACEKQKFWNDVCYWPSTGDTGTVHYPYRVPSPSRVQGKQQWHRHARLIRRHNSKRRENTGTTAASHDVHDRTAAARTALVR